MGNTQSTGNPCETNSSGKVISGLKGDILICNQETFAIGNRDGSAEDVAKLEKTFGPDGLGLRVKNLLNMRKEELLQAFNDHAAKMSEDDDCLVIFVMTHGGRNGILHAKDETFRTCDVWKPYEACSRLNGIPKIIFFQACRSNKKSKKEGYYSNKESSSGQITTNCTIHSLPELPKTSDFLIGYSTVEDRSSTRHTDEGSWYVDGICHEIEILSKPTDVKELLTRVTDFVIRYKRNIEKEGQTPIFFSLLRKSWKIPPKQQESKQNGTKQEQGTQSGKVVIIQPPKNYANEGNGYAIILYYKGTSKIADNYKDALNELRYYAEMRELNSNTIEYLTNKALSEDLEKYFGLLIITLSPIVKKTKDIDNGNVLQDTFIEVEKERKLHIQDFWFYFKGSQCARLLNKPKLFFHIDPGCSKEDNYEESDEGYVEDDTTEHADLFRLVGQGKELSDAVLKELKTAKPGEREVLTISTNVMSKANAKKPLPYIESTLRFPWEFLKSSNSDALQDSEEEDEYCVPEGDTENQNIGEHDSPNEAGNSVGPNTKVFLPMQVHIPFANMKIQDAVCDASKKFQQDSQWAIGIDFGTSYCCVAINKNGKIQFATDDEGNIKIPSAVAIVPHGTSLKKRIGYDALQCKDNPENVITGVKRLLGRDMDDPNIQNYSENSPVKLTRTEDGDAIIQTIVDGKPHVHTPQDISSCLLEKLKEMTEKITGVGAVTNAAITVPSYFNERQRRSIIAAAATAGIGAITLVDEIMAAAHTYKTKFLKAARKINVLFADIGGGTTVVSLIEFHGESVKVLAAKGNDIGGEDFNTNLVDYCVRELQEDPGCEVSITKEVKNSLRHLCEEIKQKLSEKPEPGLLEPAYAIKFNNIDTKIPISRSKFIELNTELFRKAADLVTKCLSEANVPLSGVHDTVILGGSIKIPELKEHLEESLGGKVIHNIMDSDEAIAVGASLMAAKTNN